MTKGLIDGLLNRGAESEQSVMSLAASIQVYLPKKPKATKQAA